jgi:hypothetical protein
MGRVGRLLLTQVLARAVGEQRERSEVPAPGAVEIIEAFVAEGSVNRVPSRWQERSRVVFLIAEAALVYWSTVCQTGFPLSGPGKPNAPIKPHFVDRSGLHSEYPRSRSYLPR